MKWNLVFTIVVCLFIAVCVPGCATGPQFGQETVPSGKAIVYIYRESSIVGAANVFTIISNQNTAARMVNGGYYVDVVNPGRVSYKYTTTTYSTLLYYALSKIFNDATPAGEITVAAGKEYFMKVEIHMTGITLENQPRDKGLDDIKGLSRISDAVER
jgi:uncharacterized protein DUF2846